MKRVFVIALASFLVLSGGLGCAKKAPSKVVEVMYWGSPEEIEIITNLVKNWQKKHPDIKVKLTHVPAGEPYRQKFLTRLAGGDPPDIAFVEVNIWPSFYAKNAFIPLNQFIEKDPSFNLEEFFPAVVKRFTVKGKIYIIPRDTAPFACIYYNKEIFDEAGIPYPKDNWTWQEFLEVAKKLTKRAEGKVERYGFYTWAWINFVYSAGGRLVDNIWNPRRCVLDSPEAIEGLKFYVNLSHKWGVSPTPTEMNALGMDAQGMFAMGKLAMYGSGIWETPIFRKQCSFDWDVAPFPVGPKGQYWATGGSGYGIVRGCKDPEAAWEVLKGLAGDYGQIQLAEKGLAQPANMRIAYSSHWAKSPKKPLHKDFLNWAVDHAIYYPFHPEWSKMDAIIGEYLQKAFTDPSVPVANMAKKATVEVNRILARSI